MAFRMSPQSLTVTLLQNGGIATPAFGLDLLVGAVRFAHGGITGTYYDGRS